MRGSGLSGKFTIALALAATCFSSTAVASPRPASVPAVAPLVALSAFASDFSRAAMCGTATSAAAAGSASALAATSTAGQPAPQAGCVLPVSDVAVAPLPGEPVAVLPASYNIPWALLGAVGLIGALALATLFHNDDEDSPFLPITPQ